MPKREPEHVSSEEFDYNTELEQAKESLRDELSGEGQNLSKSNPAGSTEDENKQ